MGDAEEYKVLMSKVKGNKSYLTRLVDGVTQYVDAPLLGVKIWLKQSNIR